MQYDSRVMTGGREKLKSISALIRNKNILLLPTASLPENLACRAAQYIMVRSTNSALRPLTPAQPEKLAMRKG